MMRALTAISSFLLVASTTFPAGSDEARPGANESHPEVGAAKGNVTSITMVKPRKLSPLMRSIAAVFESEKKEIAVLRDRLEATRDPAAALAIHREIGKIKEDSELAVLKLQANAARAQGRAEATARLDQAIADYEAARVERAAAVR